MIDADEIQRRARTLGILEAHAWRDYVLNHLLAALVDGQADVVFRGGTALARIYWPDFRLSEDLDFITPGRSRDVNEALGRAVERSADASGLPLSMSMQTLPGGRTRSTVSWDGAEVVVDVMGYEQPVLDAKDKPLVLPYSDLADPVRRMRTVALAEILGNKWYMLDDRDEPRDLFDLWWGLSRGGVGFSHIADGHEAKYGFAPVAAQIENAARLRQSWEMRLGHQVAELPEFDAVFRVVRERFEGWLNNKGRSQ